MIPCILEKERNVSPLQKRNYMKIKPGDELVLVSLVTARKLLKKVSFVRVYKTVREMAEKEEVGKIFPGAYSADELIAVFEEFKRKWGKAYATKLEENGVVAIGME